MTDKIEKIGNSIIQHGKENNRVYLMKLAEKDYPNILEPLENLAINDGYSKIVAKVPANFKAHFIKNGYQNEAVIEKFFKGEEDCYFLCKYFSKEREEFTDRNDILMIAQFCMEKAKLSKLPENKNGFDIRQLNKDNVSQMIKIYNEVFKSYPFPIHDGNYIIKTMNENIDYFGAFYKNKLVATSSSEMDLENLNTEMTDFATLQDYRGHNLSYHLLSAMEKSATQKGIKTAYTIARAKSTGINMTFAKKMYNFGGTLINNTNICENIETMNVWYKSLPSGLK